VTSVDDEPDANIDSNVCESRTTYEGAVDACVDYIMDRVWIRDDIRYALMHDVNHDVSKFVEASGMCEDGLMDLFDYGPRAPHWQNFSMPDMVDKALRDYLKGVVHAESGYEIGTDFDSKIGVCTYIFAIQDSVLKED
jgi:hypothetical protein